MNMLLRLACALVALLAFAPSEARAAWVGTWGDHLYYNAAAGELNTVRVTLQPNGDIRFTDAGANPMIAESGCSRPGTSVADCSSAGITHIKVRLEDRDDLAIIDVGLRALVWGHDGDDTLVGGVGNDELYGGWGADELSGRGGSDVMDAGANLGDSALYSDHSTPVLVELVDGKDETAGSAGENDRLYGIRNLSGGAAGDTLFGDGRRNQIWGGGGADTLGGGPLSDSLNGGSGDDVFIEGWLQGGGADDMVGGADTDVVDYSAGNWPIYFGEGVVFCTGSCPPPDPDPYAEPPTSGPSTFGPIAVTLDDVANDGRTKPDNAGLRTEADNVHSDIEDITLSPGDDSATGSSVRNVIRGLGGADNIDGAGGDDSLHGGGGGDTLFGNAGADFLEGEAGGDVLAGGADIDTVTYAGSATAVTVSVGSVADDGTLGENDDVFGDVERIIGTPYGDIITGTSGSQTLIGGGGPDRLDGLEDSDRLEGGTGYDNIEARDDFPDSIDCGPDPDIAQVDRWDSFVECEQTNDAVPPRVICQTGPSDWTRGPVSIQCTATDDRSPPATPSSFTLTASLPDGQENAAVKTNVVAVCDSASPANCVDAYGFFKIDRKGPTITSRIPNARFLLNEVVPWDALVECVDYGSGLRILNGRPRCADTSPAYVPTSSAGTATFFVLAEDNLANHKTVYLPYEVGYDLCNRNTTVTATTVDVFVSLCDAQGMNVSDSGIPLENVLIDGAKPETRDGGFEFTNKAELGYVLRIPLDAISSGTHEVSFTAGLDPLVHTVQFEVP